ncbi:hypothetical protein [Serinicoccus marinus]|uniref:hypothetical protein n=1 Tax=Serinicoccus marinus TaxID=247333 RepID=UPI00122DCBC9|nr:hypothetical protein [Serinicoccus marinus]
MTGTRCTIIPGYLLARIAQADPEVAPVVQATLQDSERTRGRRELMATRWPGGEPPSQGTILPTTLPLRGCPPNRSSTPTWRGPSCPRRRGAPAQHLRRWWGDHAARPVGPRRG